MSGGKPRVLTYSGQNKPGRAGATRSVMIAWVYAACVIMLANAGCPRPTGIEVVL